jgi:hypothetical protein
MEKFEKSFDFYVVSGTEDYGREDKSEKNVIIEFQTFFIIFEGCYKR